MDLQKRTFMKITINSDDELQSEESWNILDFMNTIQESKKFEADTNLKKIPTKTSTWSVFAQ